MDPSFVRVSIFGYVAIDYMKIQGPIQRDHVKLVKDLFVPGMKLQSEMLCTQQMHQQFLRYLFMTLLRSIKLNYMVA